MTAFGESNSPTLECEFSSGREHSLPLRCMPLSEDTKGAVVAPREQEDATGDVVKDGVVGEAS